MSLTSGTRLGSYEVVAAIGAGGMGEVYRALRSLERDGLVTRTVHTDSPPRVDYRLTSLGQELHDAVERLLLWAQEKSGVVGTARERYDRRKALRSR